ncbi:hypothetical protein [Sphingobium cloacae]|uniref:hypothetical protein n=1 Tax=Sphingobium cloacae TaxID=120107 RepID=UPI000A40CE5F|nr:hypothetical protein [Sphingobium cloacae]
MGARKESKTIRLDVGVWFNEASGHIHIAAKDAFISTVSNDPRSKRYHPNLYRKLAACLRDGGVPHPAAGAEDA